MKRLSHILILMSLQVILAVTGVATLTGGGMDMVCRAASSSAAHTGEQNEQYDVKHPLIYEDSWEKWPYAYLSDEGKPCGFNIELMTRIMQRLKIHYEVRLRNQKTAHEDLRADSADVTLGVASVRAKEYGKVGKFTICYFTNSILMPRSKAVAKITKEDLMSRRVVVTNRGSGVLPYLRSQGMPDSLLTKVSNMETEILREAMNGTGGAVWQTMMMKWVLRKYHLDDRYVAVPIDMQPVGYRFISNDTVLLARLDSVCQEMEKSGELAKLTDKWFYPEKQQKDDGFAKPLLIMLSVVMVLIIFFLVGSRHLKVFTHSTLGDLRQQMRLVFHSNKQRMWVYYPDLRRYSWMTSDGVAETLYSSFEFSRFYPDGDFDCINAHVMTLAEGAKGPITETVRCESLTQPGKVLDVEVTMKELYDEYGKVYLISGLQYDVSDSKAVLDHMKVLQERYTTAFAMARGTVMRFDENKRMVAINEIGCDRLGISDIDAFLAEGYYLDDIDLIDDIDIEEAPEELRFTRKIEHRDIHNVRYASSKYFNHKNYAMIGYYDSNIPGDEKLRRSTVGYYEVHLVKSLDDKGRPISYMLFINNRTDEIHGLRRLSQMRRQIRQLRDDNEKLHRRRDYTLQVTDIWLVEYDPERKLLIIKDRNNVRPPYSQVALLEISDPTYVKKVFKVFRKLDAKVRSDVTMDIKTYLRNERGEQRYFHFDVRPAYNSSGSVASYFGTCRDITAEVYAQKKLLNETRIVEEAEHLKSDFLKNTSFSLRQPLINMSQSIAQLRNGVNTEMQNDIVASITGNTRRLIKLSDDTLLLSRIEAGMLTMRREPTDFVPLFTQTVNETMAEYPSAGITYSVENTYDKLMLNVDPTHLKRIIHEVTGLAARYVHVGHITLRYMYVKGILSLVVQDNGQGIPPSIVAHMFEPHIGEDVNVSNHSVYLSGLEMPICKALLGLANGTIDIESDPGRGTTIYIRVGIQSMDTITPAVENNDEGSMDDMLKEG